MIAVHLNQVLGVLGKVNFIEALFGVCASCAAVLRPCGFRFFGFRFSCAVHWQCADIKYKAGHVYV